MKLDIFVVPDIWNMLAQWGATLILFLVIRHFVYKPMNAFLQKRQDRVMEDLNEAATKKEEALQLKSRYEEEISSAQGQGAEIIEESRRRAGILEEEKLQEAKKEANAILEKARLQIQSEKELASEEVRKETVDIALLMAQKILSNSLDHEKQEKLVDSFIRELEQDHVR